VASPPHPVVRLLKRAWPWLVGIGLLTIIISRVPVAAFRTALDRGPHVKLALVDLGVVIVTLCSDSVSTWFGLVACQLRRPLSKVFAIGGATYMLFLVNYALGQGGFGFFLRRSGATTGQAIGATLFLVGTNLATLLLGTTLALAFHRELADPRMWWILLGCDAGLVAYLIVVAISPRFLTRRETLSPLFEAGVRGHALAILGRVPHTTVIVVGVWLSARTWGIVMPFGDGIAIAPIIVIASVLPIAPAGLGTGQAATVFLFANYAVGATADDRNAAVLAFAVVNFVYAVASSLVVGLACIPIARRAGVLAEAPPMSAASVSQASQA